MQDKLLALVDRLKKDVDSMPWLDPGMKGPNFHQSVQYFVEAFHRDAQALINESAAEQPVATPLEQPVANAVVTPPNPEEQPNA